MNKTLTVKQAVDMYLGSFRLYKVKYKSEGEFFKYVATSDLLRFMKENDVIFETVDVLEGRVAVDLDIEVDNRARMMDEDGSGEEYYGKVKSLDI